MLSDTESICIGALIHIKQDALIRILILKLDFLSGINLRQRRILTGAKKVPLQKIAFFICYRICFSGIPTAIYRLADVKCAVSEAVTNCIVHAYRGVRPGAFYITATVSEGDILRVSVSDTGCGIADVRKAREPLFTTDPAGERSGMGFTVMENFMDSLCVYSGKGKGTLVVMTKRFGKETRKG